MLELIKPPEMLQENFTVDPGFVGKILRRKPLEFPGRTYLKMVIKTDEKFDYKSYLIIGNFTFYGVIPIKRLEDGSVECIIDGYKEEKPCPECNDTGQFINADGKTDGCLTCGKVAQIG